MRDTTNLFDYPPVMALSDVTAVLGMNEHLVRSLREAGEIETVAIGARVGYLRWSLAAFLGLVDPDVAAARAAADVVLARETVPSQDGPGTASIDPTTPLRSVTTEEAAHA